mgnify:FL=1
MSKNSLDRLNEIKASAHLGGGQDRIDKQHETGKLTARERLDLLLDPGSFVEVDSLAVDNNIEGQPFYGDAVVTGWGQIDGRSVAVFSQDFTVFGGSLGEVMGAKICKIMDLATKTGVPIIGVNDGAGARIQEGVSGLAGYGDIFYRNVQASGVIPQISIIAGPCAGGAVYSPALTDFIFMVEENSYMFLTGPDVVLAATGEETTAEELGGASSHTAKSGVAHFSAATEEDLILDVRTLLSYLPSNNLDDTPVELSTDPIDRDLNDIRDIVPEDADKPYDIRDVIERIVDESSFLETHERFAPNIVVGFARIEGKAVGIVGNQPLYLAGVLDIDSSRKAARFVQFCDSFNLPVVTLVDVPGYLPGVSQEYGGIIGHGAKLVYAYAAATVPKVTLILRKGFGGAYDAMGSKHLGADINFAWAGSAIAVMAGTQAVNIINRRELANADNEEETRAELVQQYKDKLEHPYIAAGRGYIDDVIDPRESRLKIAQALRVLSTKSEKGLAKKHGNIPL